MDQPHGSGARHRPPQPPASGAFSSLDLDNFEKINDTLGHPVGDRPLSAAARRLSTRLREEDILARLGATSSSSSCPSSTTQRMPPWLPAS
ncbi:MAG: diguanylate cyclase [Zoogloea sp.]|nr:diguanylate cyclase [Zoogloea sp.]